MASKQGAVSKNKITPSPTLRGRARTTFSHQNSKIKFSYTLILGLLLIAGGLFLVVFSSGIKSFNNIKNDGITSVSGRDSASIGRPEKIFIPKIGRYLPIEDGQVEDNRWKISQKGVSYLVSTPRPGEVGNTVMYGHNTDNILGRIVKLAGGDKIYITNTDGSIYKYEVFETKEIKPDQVEILSQTEDMRLTIYTCSGFLDQARFVAFAKLVSRK